MEKPNLMAMNKRIKEFNYYVQKVFPAVYDDSLSYYELLSKIIKHLNEIGLLTNDMVSLWNQINEWVLNDGLTQTLENKIEQLIINGTLENMLNTTLLENHTNRMTDNFRNGQKSLIRNSDLIELPYIQSRSSVYTFDKVSFSGTTALRVQSVGYENATEENKDFAFVLMSNIKPTDQIRLKMRVYTTEENQRLRIRLAYGNGVTLDLGTANQWNEIDITTILGGQQQTNFIYFDLLGSYTLYIEKGFEVLNTIENIELSVDSFQEINKNLVDTPLKILNSSGDITKMIDIASTYQSKLNNFIYGNSYTAFDYEVQQVSGKYQMDCSSFVNLMIRGIEFEKSRYNGLDNIGNPLFFQNMNPYNSRYANNMGRWLTDRGYTFKPNNDLSNLRPGDILFFSWNNPSSVGDTPMEARKSNFEMIDHVAIYLNKKNDSRYRTIQYYPGATDLFYDATPEYMSQCVLVARVPFANAENPHSSENLLVNGNVSKTAVNTPDIGFYRMNRALQKGKYYTLFIKGQVTSLNSYFLVQVNNQIVYSDFGQSQPYEGIVKIGFYYNLDDITRDIKISIGSTLAANQRNGYIEWISMYEGFIDSKNRYEESVNHGTLYDFPLDSTLVSDINSEYNPYYKYLVEGNKIYLNLNIPLQTERSGNIMLGSLPTNTVITAQRVPVNLVNNSNETIAAVLQVNPSGTVMLINYSMLFNWKTIHCNGVIFRE